MLASFSFFFYSISILFVFAYRLVRIGAIVTIRLTSAVSFILFNATGTHSKYRQEKLKAKAEAVHKAQPSSENPAAHVVRLYDYRVVDALLNTIDCPSRATPSSMADPVSCVEKLLVWEESFA
jgi:hypothetical protein